MANETNEDDLVDSSEGERDEAAPARRLVTAEMIAKTDLGAVLAAVADQDDDAVEKQLRASEKVATEAGDVDRADALELFASIMFIAVRPDDEANPFTAKLVMDGRRSMIPDDIVGEQSAILAEIVETLPNPHLRAKVGDIVFYNSRKHWKAAATAIDAYCEIARGRLDDTIKPRPSRPADSIMDVVEPLARATALTRLTKKRGDIPVLVRQTLQACYDAALAGCHYVVFVKIAELGIWHGILEASQVARDAEELARNAPPGTYPEAVKRVWIIAASSHDRLNNKDDANRCRVEAAEQTLKMRDESNQPAVKAHWTKAALGEMRHLSGTRDRIEQLRNELRTFQMAAQDDFGSFTTPMDLSETRREIEALFVGISFADACVQFYHMSEAPSKQELRDTVLELARKDPLGAMISSSYYDAEGREAARAPAMPSDGSPSENWFRAEGARYMDVLMFQQVRGKIEPARLSLVERISIQERHLLPIAEASVFVPPGREPLFAMGFARMFQGDYATAAHLLLPQLENSLRHILMLSNRDPSKIEQDLIQGDRALSQLLEVNRGELEAILGEDVVDEIDILFNFRPGPALRNEAAHGKLPWGAFFHHSTIFGCWFIFGLTCRPLFHVWQEQIAPLLAAETDGQL
ncbi:DUF4209 domain-containing protein [Alteriqipengyuania sp. NZ-12B]|uniref:DUF4209 domain-containing protein n=1 Tax=Alteriqipengyuania abyssalis TaxID=2860200 RepID=A0ABS7PFR0_9SPHN|nr:DUF4209 domain-containing protein [Alteriqipengyuania abyssalis]MBY8337045.1 DUF4209 domain-containing protein [Alteriqipengyuania abyssalis]